MTSSRRKKKDKEPYPDGLLSSHLRQAFVEVRGLEQRLDVDRRWLVRRGPRIGPLAEGQ